MSTKRLRKLHRKFTRLAIECELDITADCDCDECLRNQGRREAYQEAASWVALELLECLHRQTTQPSRQQVRELPSVN